MEIEKLITYPQILDHLNKEKRTKHLLLGNGFSMAYDDKIFSYNALSNFIERTENPLLLKLFEIINTKNFEQIMHHLDMFCKIAETFSTDKELINRVEEACSVLKSSLIDAVKELHPEHVFTIPAEDSKRCSTFLEEYISKNGKIFSTNYDLLLYWILMRNKSENAVDGFGRELENPEKMKGEEKEYSELRWGKHRGTQSIYYLHGALPIFDNGIDIIKEEYDSEHYILENIKQRMENQDYPVFVTAGNAKEKLNHIMHNKYLSNCYDELTVITGSLITFGFNFGGYDTHIIDAINKAAQFRKDVNGKLLSVYIGVYTDSGLEYIKSITKRFRCKVTPYNARTAAIWR